MGEQLTPQYVAGLFDASGYLSLRKRQQRGITFYAVKASLSISHPGLLERVRAQYGGRIQPTKRGTMTLDWNSREGIVGLLTDIRPYLIVMADKAQEMLDFIGSKK